MIKSAALIGLQTITIKEVTRFTRIWIQTIIAPIITTTLYFVIFGNVIGRFVPTQNGMSYMDFIVPGLIMLSIINNSYMNVVSSFFSSKFQRSVEEILVSPTPNAYILLGYVSGGVLRGLVVGAIVWIIAQFFQPTPIHNFFLMLIITLLTATLFSLAGFVNAMFARKFDDISLVPTFILTPLTYLGGVFYSVSALPDIWRDVSYANPILYIINAFRYSFLGITDVPIGIAFAIIIFATVVLFFVALFLLNKGFGLRH